MLDPDTEAVPARENTWNADLLRLVPELLGLARGLVGSGPDAEDLVQDTIAGLLSSWPDGVRNARAYARRALINRYTDQIRHDRVVRSKEHEFQLPINSDPSDQMDVRLTVEQALLQLDPRIRAILVLRFFGGFNAREVAATLGTTSGSVRRLTHEGLATLRRSAFLTRADVERR